MVPAARASKHVARADRRETPCPERAHYHSPGQRPGANRPQVVQALKGRHKLRSPFQGWPCPASPNPRALPWGDEARPFGADAYLGESGARWVWLYCVYWAGTLSNWKPGWGRILACFHLVGLLGFVAVGLTLAGTLCLCRAITEGSTVGVAFGALGSSCGAIGLAVVFLAYRRVKVGLTRMLRESSIELARVERSLRTTGLLHRVRLLSYLDADD